VAYFPWGRVVFNFRCGRGVGGGGEGGWSSKGQPLGGLPAPGGSLGQMVGGEEKGGGGGGVCGGVSGWGAVSLTNTTHEPEPS